MYFKEFGGMPWRYFFNERPAFTKDDWFYFVLIHKSGEFFSCSNRLTTDLYPEQALTIEGEEIIEYFINIDKDKIRIPVDTLINFFLNHESILLPWVKKEIEEAETGKIDDTDIPEYTTTRIFFHIKKYMADSLYMVSDGASIKTQEQLFDRFNERLWGMLSDEARSEISAVIGESSNAEQSKKEDTIPDFILRTFRYYVDKKLLVEKKTKEGEIFFTFNTAINPETGREYCKGSSEFFEYYNKEAKNKGYTIPENYLLKYLWNYIKKTGEYKPYSNEYFHKNRL